MEAIARCSSNRNRGGVAGCCFHRSESVLTAVAETKNVVFPYEKCLVTRRGIRSIRPSSTSFEDQTHVQFYFENRVDRSGKPFRKTRAVAASFNIAAVRESAEVIDQGTGEFLGQIDFKRQVRKDKKTLKKLRKEAKGEASSSSSSSSESETYRPVRGTRTRRTNIDQLRREWETIAQSPLMQSGWTISSDFHVEKSQQLLAPALTISPANGSSDGKQCSSSSMPSAITPTDSSSPATKTTALGSLNANGTAFATSIFMAGLAVPCDISEASTTARVEVCMGRKCQRAGAEQVLSAFQTNGIPASCANKCMKNCKAAINVRVVQQENGMDHAQMHSRVGLEDVDALSQKYFAVRVGPSASDRNR